MTMGADAPGAQTLRRPLPLTLCVGAQRAPKSKGERVVPLPVPRHRRPRPRALLARGELEVRRHHEPDRAP